MGGVKIMKYYKNTNDRIDSFLTEGAIEITSPVRADGTLLPQHDNLNLVATDTDGKYFKYYLTTPDADGIYQADTVKIVTEAMTATANLIESTMQTHMDDTAKLFGFATGMDRAGSYVGYANIYQADALTLVNWRALVWEYVQAEQAKVIAGTRTMPTVDEMMAEVLALFPTPVKA